jgi:hypothetical protein
MVLACPPSMSDDITTFVPDDPRFVPGKKAQQTAVAVLRALAPRADEITNGVDDEVTFRDCGANFESVACPKCRREIDLQIWQSWMSDDSTDGGGFRLASFATPCCALSVTLNDLAYTLPQAFSRYHLSARNAGRKFSAASITKLEQALGCRLRVVRQHI